MLFVVLRVVLGAEVPRGYPFNCALYSGSPSGLSCNSDQWVDPKGAVGLDQDFYVCDGSCVKKLNDGGAAKYAGHCKEQSSNGPFDGVDLTTARFDKPFDIALNL